MDYAHKELNYTNMILKMIDRSVGIDTINDYVADTCSREFVELKSMEQVRLMFSGSVDNFLDSLSYEELMDLRSYTGYNYKFINAILRDRWNYEEHGELNNDKKVEYSNLARKISELLSRFDAPKIDFMCFRGTKIEAFKGYGITELSQLRGLRGQFLYERGFSSTSILSETSYFNNKNLEEQYKGNIEIRYLIPAEANDGALLISRDTSYSINQNEFLLNSGSLSKVVDVYVDEEKNIAVLTVMLVPKKVYELGYNKDNNIKR